jgi:glycosyltransferase involved in cell wall biosynthesis
MTVRPFLWMVDKIDSVIYCPHGWSWDRPWPKAAKLLYSFIERLLGLGDLTDWIVCISEYERQSALNMGVKTKKLKLVLNGIPDVSPMAIDFVIKWPTNAKRVLFVGRFDKQKGLDVLCDALEKLGESVFAVLAGEAVLGDEKCKKLPSNTMAIGWVSPEKLESLFYQSDMLVVPSRWESFGLIAVEAMRASLPVIASRVGGLAEVVVNGETGLLVEPGNVDELVRAISQLSREKKKAMGEKGFQRFKKCFTVTRVHQELLRLYDLE